MKYKLWILTVFTLLTGCEDLLFDREADPFNGEDTRAEVQSIIDGVHYNMTKIFNSEYFKIGIRADDYVPTVRGFTSGNYNPFTDTVCAIKEYEVEIPTQQISDFYRLSYRAITSINKCIETYESLNTDGELDDLLGEIYLLRAYLYFKIARIFSDAPLVLDSEIKYNLKKSSYKELVDQVLADLSIAEQLLPKSRNLKEETYPKPMTGTVKAVRSEVYLTRAGYPMYEEGMYALAANEAQYVIEHADNFGFALEPDFQHLWDSEYKYNSENVLSIFCRRAGYEGELVIANHIESGLSYPYSGEGLKMSGYSPEFNFYNSFPVNYRKRVTFTTESWSMEIRSANDNDYYRGHSYLEVLTAWDHCILYDRIFYKKWIDYQQYIGNYDRYYRGGNLSLDNSAQTLYLYRFAHTLLTYAEAAARSGQLNTLAYDAVNQVRRRANKIDLYTPSEFDLSGNLTTEQFLDSVICERAWEFAKEPEGRWFDVIRLDLEEQIINSRHPDERINVFPGEPYFYDIPDDELHLN